MPGEHSEGLFSEILERISDARLRARVPIVAFDLDETLLNPPSSVLDPFEDNFRAIALIKEVARRIANDEDAVAKLTLDEAAKNCRVEVDVLRKAMHDYCLERAKLGGKEPEDQAVAGAPDFIREILFLRGVVAFLTRRTEAEREATLKSLAHQDFPLPGEMPWKDRVQLIMEPDEEKSELEFKVAAVDSLGAKGEVIACFDHDPAVLERLLIHFPDTTMVLLNMHHASKHPVRDSRIVAVEDLLPKK